MGIGLTMAVNHIQVLLYICCVPVSVEFLHHICRTSGDIVFFIQLKDSASNGQRHVNILVRVSVDINSSSF